MTFFRGKLLEGDNVLADPIDAWIEIDQGTGKLHSWSGTFDLPEGHQFSFVDHSTCDLVLDDGRSGRIIPARCDGLTVEFQGSGPLE